MVNRPDHLSFLIAGLDEDLTLDAQPKEPAKAPSEIEKKVGGVFVDSIAAQSEVEQKGPGQPVSAGRKIEFPSTPTATEKKIMSCSKVFFGVLSETVPLSESPLSRTDSDASLKSASSISSQKGISSTGAEKRVEAEKTADKVDQRTIRGVLCNLVAKGAAKLVWIPGKTALASLKSEAEAGLGEIAGKLNQAKDDLEKGSMSQATYDATVQGFQETIEKCNEKLRLHEEMSQAAFYSPTDEDLARILSSVKKEGVEREGGVTKKEAEIEYERGLALKMVELYKKKTGEEPSNVAVNLGLLKDEKGYLIQTSAAEGDLESYIRKEGLTFGKRAKLIQGSVTGLRQMHDVNVAAGDVKPENNLVFNSQKLGMKGEKSWITKMSDFGKSRLMSSMPKINSGNPRFAPPEVTLSLAGDVYGEGLVIIRGLEEDLLQKMNKDCLLDIQKSKNPYKQEVEKAGRRGVEKFRVCDKRYPSFETSGLSDPTRKKEKKAAYKAYVKAKLSLSKATQEKVMHEYVDALVGGLKESHAAGNREKEKAIDGLGRMLKQMLSSSPSKRPKMSEVEKQYQQFVDAIEEGS